MKRIKAKRSNIFAGLKKLWQDGRQEKKQRTSAKLRNRSLRLEPLESRELLSLTIGNYVVSDAATDGGTGWVYTQSTNTLALTNYQGGQIVAENIDLKIEIHGTVSLAAGNSPSNLNAIKVIGGDLTIDGKTADAKLNLRVYSINTTVDSAICVEKTTTGGDLTIQNLNLLDIQSAENDRVSGIHATGTVDFANNAAVTINVAPGTDAVRSDAALSFSANGSNATKDSYKFLGGGIHIAGTLSFTNTETALPSTFSNTGTTGTRTELPINLELIEAGRTIDYVANDDASLRYAVVSSAGVQNVDILVAANITTTSALDVGKNSSGTFLENTEISLLSGGDWAIKRNGGFSVFNVGGTSTTTARRSIVLNLGTASGMGTSTLNVDGGANWSDVPLSGEKATFFSNVAGQAFTIGVGEQYKFGDTVKTATSAFTILGTGTYAIAETTDADNVKHYNTATYTLKDATGIDGVGTYVLTLDLTNGIGNDYNLPYYAVSINGSLTVVSRKNTGVSSTHPIVLVCGTMNMYSNVAIQNGQNTTSGDSGNLAGGVYVAGSASSSSAASANALFNLYGGSIRYNEAQRGGGVNLQGVMNVYGGEITGNASKSGGGEDDTKAGEGAGIRVKYGTLTFNDGTISQNCCYGTFQKENGNADNAADAKGGGIHNSGSSYTYFNGGSIEENICTSLGGGLYAGGTGSGHFYMNGGTISNNVANQGGGVYMNSGLELSGGSIAYNNVAGGTSFPIAVLAYRGSSFNKFTAVVGTTTTTNGNVVDPYGNGIFVRSRSTNTTTNFPIISISGSIKVDSNNDVYLYSNQNQNNTAYFVPIHVTGELTTPGLVMLVDVNPSTFKTNSESGTKGGSGETAVGYRDFVKFNSGLTLQPEKFATSSNCLTVVPNATSGTWGDGSCTSANNVAFNVTHQTGSPEVDFIRIFAKDNATNTTVVNETNYLVQTGAAASLYIDYLAQTLHYKNVYVMIVRNFGVHSQFVYGNFSTNDFNLYLFSEDSTNKVQRKDEHDIVQEMTLIDSSVLNGRTGWSQLGTDDIGKYLYANTTSYQYVPSGDYTVTVLEDFACDQENNSVFLVDSNVNLTIGETDKPANYMMFDGDYTRPIPCSVFTVFGTLTLTGNVTIQNMTNDHPMVCEFVASGGGVTAYGAKRVYWDKTTQSQIDRTIYTSTIDGCTLTSSTTTGTGATYITTTVFTEGTENAKLTTTIETYIVAGKIGATVVNTVDANNNPATSAYSFFTDYTALKNDHKDANDKPVPRIHTQILKLTADAEGCRYFAVYTDPTLANTSDRNYVRDGYFNYDICPGTLNIENGVTIQDCVGADAGGVNVINGATLIMSGGTITDCVGGSAGPWGDATSALLGGGGVTVYHSMAYASIFNLAYHDETDGASLQYKFTIGDKAIPETNKVDNFAFAFNHSVANQTTITIVETIGGIPYTSTITVYSNGTVTSNIQTDSTLTNVTGTWNAETATLSFSATNYAGNVVAFNWTITNAGTASATVTGTANVAEAKIATMNMSGGVITGNLGEYGGGIWNEGIVNMSGGSVYGNIARYSKVVGDVKTTDHYGNGVFQCGVFNLSGSAYVGNAIGTPQSELNGVYLSAVDDSAFLNAGKKHIISVSADWTGNQKSDPLYIGSEIVDDGTRLAIVYETDAEQNVVYNSTEKSTSIDATQALIAQQKIAYLPVGGTEKGIVEETEIADYNSYDRASVTRTWNATASAWDYTENYTKFRNALTLGYATLAYGNNAVVTANTDYNLTTTQYNGGDKISVLTFSESHLKDAYASGYEFVGWNTKKDGSGLWIYPGDKNKITYTTSTLFAQWEEATPLAVTTQDDEFDLTWNSTTSQWNEDYGTHLSLREAIVIANQRALQSKAEDSSKDIYTTITFSPNEWEWEHVQVTPQTSWTSDNFTFSFNNTVANQTTITIDETIGGVQYTSTIIVKSDGTVDTTGVHANSKIDKNNVTGSWANGTATLNIPATNAAGADVASIWTVTNAGTADAQATGTFRTTTHEAYDASKSYGTTTTRVPSSAGGVKTVVVTTVSYGGLHKDDQSEELHIYKYTDVTTYQFSEWIFVQGNDELTLALAYSLPKITASIAISGESFYAAIGRYIRIDGATTDNGDYYSYAATRSVNPTTSAKVRVMTIDVANGTANITLTPDENVYKKAGVGDEFSFSRDENDNSGLLTYKGRNNSTTVITVTTSFNVSATVNGVARTISESGGVCTVESVTGDVATFTVSRSGDVVTYTITTTDTAGNDVTITATIDVAAAAKTTVTATSNYVWNNPVLLETLSFINGGGTHSVDSRINGVHQQEAVYNDGHGGAIFISNKNASNVSIVDGIFKSCSAASEKVGGAIANRGTLSLSACVFESNGGGTIAFDSVEQLPTSMTSANTKYGGALYNSGTATITNKCVFKFNGAENAGGAIYNSSGMTIDGDSSAFQNISNGDGGAIYNYKTAGTTTSYLTISSADISGNKAAGVHGTNSDGENLKDGFGGGLMNYAGLGVTLTNVLMDRNVANRNGGAICNATSGTRNVDEIIGTITLSACCITDNKAEYGGGVLNGGVMTIYGTEISGNTAVRNGGGISNTDHTQSVTPDETNINAQTGSQLFIYNSESSQTPTVIQNNVAGEYGGGISDWGKTCSINGTTTITGNKAAYKKGSQISKTTYSNCTIGPKVVVGPNGLNEITWLNPEKVDWKDVVTGSSALPLASLLTEESLGSVSTISLAAENGREIQLSPTDSFSVNQLGIAGTGVYALTLTVYDVRGSVAAETTIDVSVVFESPTIDVQATTTPDGTVLALTFDVQTSSGVSAEQWIVHWGDGSTTAVSSLSDSLAAIHYYPPQTTDQTYAVTLELIDAAGNGEGLRYAVASRFVPAAASPTDDSVSSVVSVSLAPLPAIETNAVLETQATVQNLLPTASPLSFDSTAIVFAEINLPESDAAWSNATSSVGDASRFEAVFADEDDDVFDWDFAAGKIDENARNDELDSSVWKNWLDVSSI